MGVSFVTVYKMAEPVAQQMRNCVCKTQTATTGTRPPLVASQYSKCSTFQNVRKAMKLTKYVSDYMKTICRRFDDFANTLIKPVSPSFVMHLIQCILVDSSITYDGRDHLLF